jgi:predicted AAA+ superfamily ATPase
MFTRIATQEIEESLLHQAAVAIIGPRQIGKTTLAIQEIGAKHDAVYLDLEDSNDRNRLANPKLYLENIGNRLVILDEIHRMPEIFQSLRGIIDNARREGEGIGRFLILGSASIDLLHQSSESLAGRISYIEMTGLNVLEIEESRISC